MTDLIGQIAISVIVMVLFFLALFMTLTQQVPPGSEAVSQVLLGSIAGMATQVVNYWIGSSRGSARKTEIAAKQAEVAAGVSADAAGTAATVAATVAAEVVGTAAGLAASNAVRDRA